MALLCNSGAAPMVPYHPHSWCSVSPQSPVPPRWQPSVTVPSLVAQISLEPVQQQVGSGRHCPMPARHPRRGVSSCGASRSAVSMLMVIRVKALLRFPLQTPATSWVTPPFPVFSRVAEGVPAHQGECRGKGGGSFEASGPGSCGPPGRVRELRRVIALYMPLAAVALPCPMSQAPTSPPWSLDCPMWHPRSPPTPSPPLPCTVQPVCSQFNKVHGFHTKKSCGVSFCVDSFIAQVWHRARGWLLTGWDVSKVGAWRTRLGPADLFRHQSATSPGARNSSTAAQS